LSGAKIKLPGADSLISPGALITLLKEDESTKVLSSPHILTADNEKAKIVVGDKLFYESSQVAAGSAVPVKKIEKEDVDLRLEIKPNVAPKDRYLTLKIDIRANEGGIGANGLPNVGKRETSQLVTLRNGQTAVISGLVKLREEEQYQKIPLLGDIPILGWLFRNSHVVKVQKNLMIFLTPNIVYGANDLAKIFDKKVAERREIMAKIFGSDRDAA
jgi:general secretion pathway protein D